MERGYRLGLVTSGTGSRVRKEADCHGLLSSFEVLVCNEDTVNKKPHPEALEKAMALMRAAPRNCCYVGDSPEDIQMGKRASLLTVAVMSGYPCSRRLLETGPDLSIGRLAEILDYFPG